MSRAATRGRYLQAIVFSLAVGLSGCSSLGPATVPVDKFDYNGAIAEAQQQELLLNLVRLRYSEPPVFLKVSSVISQYSLSAGTSIGGGFNTGLNGNDTANIGGRVGWTDRPVITYTPVSGQEFSRNLLTPLQLRAIFTLFRSGWSPELVFRTSTMSFNGLDNDRARLSSRRQGDPELFEMLTVWQRLREDGVMDVSWRDAGGPDGDLELFVNPDKTGTNTGDLARFRELLGLSADAKQYRIVSGVLPRSPDEIAITTGSLWDIMLNLAWQFEAPPEDVSSGKTGPTFRSERFGGRPPIRILNSTEKPAKAYATAFTAGRWFYVEDTDMASKQAFSFLQLLLSLAETGTQDRAPVLTISN